MAEPRRRGLAVVRCGRSTLHPSWRTGAAAAEWDLQIVPYEPGDPGWPPVRSGQKWDGLHAHLLADRRWQDYDYVWLPDDDLAIDAAGIAGLFERCRRYGAALAQPALSADSYWSIPLTLVNRAFVARATTFVEVMAPCFRVDVLRELLPTFTLTRDGLGFGLDQLWGHRLGHRGLFIFDDLTMRHTRPVGAQRDPSQAARLKRDFWRLLARHEVRFALRTLRGFEADGTAVEADEGPFLLRYLNGYDYLIQQQPWVLRRLVQEQTRRPRIVRRGLRGLIRKIGRRR